MIKGRYARRTVAPNFGAQFSNLSDSAVKASEAPQAGLCLGET
jgi:hypothetical protein